jgi:hypothetical protein
VKGYKGEFYLPSNDNSFLEPVEVGRWKTFHETFEVAIQKRMERLNGEQQDFIEERV